jgi:hypothetical protein
MNKTSKRLASAATICGGLTGSVSAWAAPVMNQIPQPPAEPLIPHAGVFWFGMFNLTLMTLAIIAMFVVAWRTRSVFPLFFLAGAALGGFVQPIFDGNIHVRFAEPEQPANWFFYNVGYPWFIVPGNALLAGPVYLMYHKFKTGITTKGLWIAFFGWWLFNTCWEIPGTTVQSYGYYGPHPFVFSGYPLWIGMMAGIGINLAGYVAYALSKAMDGIQLWVTTALLIPVAIYGSEVITWPMWITLNGGQPVSVTTWMAALSGIICVIAFHGLTRVYAKGRAVQA